MAVQELVLGKQLWVTLLVQGLDHMAPGVPFNPAFCKNSASGTAEGIDQPISASLSHLVQMES